MFELATNTIHTLTECINIPVCALTLHQECPVLIFSSESRQPIQHIKELKNGQ